MTKPFIRETSDLPHAPDLMHLITWNIGYAGLGKESDFVADGGTQYLPPSRQAVRKNLSLIKDFLLSQTADIYLLQELAMAGLLTRGTDVLGEVDQTLCGRTRAFYADVRTKFLPPPLRAVHGLGVFSARFVEHCGVEPLPLEPSSLFPGVKRKYGVLVLRLPMEHQEGCWTLINVHLAAFDDGAQTRHRQLSAALAIAETAFDAGDHVILGGDWNYELFDVDFPSTTTLEHRFWIHPFPYALLKEGWQVAADPSIPTVRTNERPYQAGENYTTIIDGFIASPNVEILHTSAFDLGFEGTDHHPVRVKVRANGG